MSDEEDGGNVGPAAERDNRGRRQGEAVDRTRMADTNVRHATRAVWAASAGLSKSVLQYGTRHNRGEDPVTKDGFASDWLLITAVKNGEGSQKAVWGSDEAADDALDVMVTMSQGGSLSLRDMSKILVQANSERGNPGNVSRDSRFFIKLVTTSEQYGVVFEDERNIPVRTKDERDEIKSRNLSSPPKRQSRLDLSSQESPETAPRGRGRGNRGGGSLARGGGAGRARGGGRAGAAGH